MGLKKSNLWVRVWHFQFCGTWSKMSGASGCRSGSNILAGYLLIWVRVPIRDMSAGQKGVLTEVVFFLDEKYHNFYYWLTSLA
jgi:hypothetical protein